MQHLAQHREARALILLGNVASSVMSDVTAMLADNEVKLLGQLHTPVSAVLMRRLLDVYLLESMLQARA